jgi:hypothetical protein
LRDDSGPVFCTVAVGRGRCAAVTVETDAESFDSFRVLLQAADVEPIAAITKTS